MFWDCFVPDLLVTSGWAKPLLWAHFKRWWMIQITLGLVRILCVTTGQRNLQHKYNTCKETRIIEIRGVALEDGNMVVSLKFMNIWYNEIVPCSLCHLMIEESLAVASGIWIRESFIHLTINEHLLCLLYILDIVAGVGATRNKVQALSHWGFEFSWEDRHINWKIQFSLIANMIEICIGCCEAQSLGQEKDVIGLRIENWRWICDQNRIRLERLHEKRID